MKNIAPFQTRPGIGLLACALMLSACGFEPAYAPPSNIGDTVSGPISISKVEGRLGYELRRDLGMRLKPGLPGVAAGARLELRVEENNTSLRLQADESALREGLEAIVRYRLYDNAGNVIASGAFTNNVAFFSPSEPYASVTAQTGAQIELARLVAAQIHSELLLSLKPVAGDGR
jgi:hypothetical protein